MAFAQIRRARLSLYLHAQIRISTLQASLHVADRQVDSLRFDDCGRDRPFGRPPAQIPACAT